MPMAVDVSFATRRRITLDDQSWVDVVPGWLSGSDALLEELLDGVPWQQRDRWMYDKVVDEPRLTVEYKTLEHETPHPILTAAAAALSAEYAVPYDGLWMNLYRDHHDSTAWHGDRPSCRREMCIVPVLTLGAQRRFLLKPRAGG